MPFEPDAREAPYAVYEFHVEGTLAGKHRKSFRLVTRPRGPGQLIVLNAKQIWVDVPTMRRRGYFYMKDMRCDALIEFTLGRPLVFYWSREGRLMSVARIDDVAYKSVLAL